MALKSGVCRNYLRATMRNSFNNQSWFVFLLLINLQYACITKKELNYLQSEDPSALDNLLIDNETPDYILLPGFKLVIDIRTTSQGATRIFEDTKRFTVNADGELELPLGGTVSVMGLKMSEAKQKILGAISPFLLDPFISIRLAEISYTVLGEFRTPDSYTSGQEALTIFRAIGKAGDLTRLANRRKVTLIREYPDGAKVHQIDLTSPDLLTSEFYYIYPQDLIYAETGDKSVLHNNRELTSLIKYALAVLGGLVVATSVL